MYSLIVPTLGTRILEFKRLLNSLLEQEGAEIELIVVAQGNFSEIRQVVNEFKEMISIKLIETNEKGLSRARNIGLKYIKGSIVVFPDDDCWYPANIFEKIKSNIESSQISTFQIFDSERNELFKEYSTVKDEHRSIFKSFKVSSIEIFVNVTELDFKNIAFDENFGLGAKYPSGEENNLLIDLIKKNYKINYYPEVVVFHPITEKEFNQNELFVKGAFLRRNFNLFFCIFLGIGFVLRKRHLINNKISSCMTILEGSFSYKGK
jgi:glycosyltransferase involved in cell wall biosynthesis